MVDERGHQLLKEIIEHNLIYPVYQPIVDLKTGDIFAYEGLTRLNNTDYFKNVLDLISFAQKTEYYSDLQYLMGHNIIEQFNDIENKKLTINFNFSFSNPEHSQLFYDKVSRIFDKKEDNIIIELSEKESLSGVNNKDIINVLQSSTSKIAIDDFGIGHSNFSKVVDFKPNIIKIDRSLISGINQNILKKSMVKSLVEIATENNIELIAEGIETIEELQTILKLGIQYAQGFLLAKPTKEIVETINDSAKEIIIEYHNKEKEKTMIYNQSKKADFVVGDLVRLQKYFSTKTSYGTFLKYFQESKTNMAVIVEDGQVLGIIDQNNIIEMFSSHYARALYYNQAINNKYLKAELIIDYNEDILSVAERALNRSDENIYNDIIVTKNNEFFGLVSIKDLLLTFTKLESERSKNLNPLTSLPGNKVIEETIKKSLDAKHYICYVDLDHFKYYNDSFGFHLGDHIIKLLANALNRISDKYSLYDPFIGHIGGDDFIVVINNDVDLYVLYDEFIGIFNHLIDDFHQDRLGFIPDIKITVSFACLEIKKCNKLDYEEILSTLTNIKKETKQIQGNAIICKTCSEMNI